MGVLTLVDRLFKMVDLKTRITSLVFSPEGAAMYIGTDGGSLLVVDLRSLEKPPKSISASRIGSRVECLVIQVRCSLHSKPAPSD